MLLRVVLLSLALFGTCSADRAAKYATNQIMSVVEQNVKLGEVTGILFVLDPSLNYSMCGYVGNRDTFPGYLESQMRHIIDIKFMVDYDNAYIEQKGDQEVLTFHVDTQALYADKTRVEGGATVTAIKKKYGAMFLISHIEQRCRMTVKRHHRLYRLFTNENLYDYKK